MRAMAYGYADGEPTVEVSEIAEPEPADGEAVVEVAACSLNHSDLWRLDGAAYDAPFVAGADLAGVVTSAPDGAAVSAGDRVVHCPNRTCGTCRYCREGPENLCAAYEIAYGGFAERAAVPADRLVALPDGVSFRQAAALPIAYMTARRMLRRGGLDAGDTVFIPGATGGVGIAGALLAMARHAEVVGSTRSAEKADRLRELGVEAIVSDDPDELRTAVADLEVDVVLNHLGGAFTGVGVAALARGGRMVVCGRTAGDRSTVELNDLYWEHKRVIGSTMGTQGDLARVVSLVADGAIDPPVDVEFVLDDGPAAIDAMRERTLFGKALVRPDA